MVGTNCNSLASMTLWVSVGVRKTKTFKPFLSSEGPGNFHHTSLSSPFTNFHTGIDTWQWLIWMEHRHGTLCNVGTHLSACLNLHNHSNIVQADSCTGTCQSSFGEITLADSSNRPVQAAYTHKPGSSGPRDSTHWLASWTQTNPRNTVQIRILCDQWSKHTLTNYYVVVVQ